jgi:hydroxylamine reductase
MFYFCNRNEARRIATVKIKRNNMEEKMFCFQCQETAKGTGCTLRGVCGKLPQTAKYMDLLLSVVRGVAIANNALSQAHMDTDAQAADFIVDALFATITNANFDDESILARVDKGVALRNALIAKAKANDIALPDYAEITWDGDKATYDEQGAKMGVKRNQNEDIRSLKELTMYGLKGMAAYYEHAARLGFTDTSITDFMSLALATISNPDAQQDELLNLVLQTGKVGVQAMALLDKANTESYGNPEITKVNIGVGKNPGILISGHDLHDIEDLLRQTEGTGIDVYTHGEMLPAHYYPQLKKYKHLVGNYGNAWWEQKEEFSTFNGPIVFTTNCIVPPLPGANYKDRMFTMNSTGYPGCRHIETSADGHKDFSEVIAEAKKCAAPTEIEHGEILGGFAHNQVLALADKIVDAVKSGAIKRFVVMGGCDGRMKSRNYYTEFAEALPKDVVILTAGCAKYKFNKLNLGDINGIPRVLDAGQCNDSYSLAVIAMKLQEVFGLDDINKLPIIYNIAWYEQKAVIVLLALLSLGVKNIHLGPTLPAFLSANVAKVLVDNFGIAGIGTVEDDLQLFGLK